MTTDLKLDAEAVQELIRGAILNAIGPEARERLIQGAINHLMTPQKDYSGRTTTTPLNSIFTNAVEQAARTIVFDSVRDDPKVQKAIDDLVSPTIASICEGNYDGLPEAIGSAVAGWLQNRTSR